MPPTPRSRPACTVRTGPKRPTSPLAPSMQTIALHMVSAIR